MNPFSFLLVLAILGIAQVILRYFKFRSNSDRVYRRTFLLLVFLGLAFALYQSLQQYWVWFRAGPPSIYLLPPYQPISYFLKYAGVNFFLKPGIAFAVSLFFLFSALALNRRFQQRFFEEDEPYLGAISLILLGHPLWIFYLPFILFIAFLVTSYQLLVTKETLRVSLYWFWLPSAILIQIIYLLLYSRS